MATILTEGKQFRFSMGSPEDQCSSLWRVWTQGDEAYIAVRNFITQAKLSLHSSGYWQFRAGDLVAVYRRPRPYQSGWTRGPGILIPHNDLDLRLPYFDGRPRDGIFWLPQPRVGQIAQFAVHFVASDIGRDSWMRDREPGLQILAALKLRSMGKLCVFRSDRDCSSAERQRISERRSLLEARHPVSSSGRLHGISVVSMESDSANQPPDV